MKKKHVHPLALLIFAAGSLLSLTSFRGSQAVAPAVQFRSYLAPSEYALLAEMLRVHLTYFQSPEAITGFRFPLTAYKAGNRARYGYSNPTEWGYAMQAWIAAAERGYISRGDATTRLSATLTTMQSLRQDPAQNYRQLFYPYYTVTNPYGNDVLLPYHDSNVWIPSGDNALLYASLVVTEGWARSIGNSALATQANALRAGMNFRLFLVQRTGKLYLAHLVNANTGELSSSQWDIFADEGGVVVWVAYLSGSITFDEFKALIESQIRHPCSWQSCQGPTYTVQECAWFNAMFTWGVRSLAGFPIGLFDAPPGSISKQ